MCGRFFVDVKNREIDRLLDELGPVRDQVKTGEIFPTNQALALSAKNGKIVPEALAWGFPRWDGKGVIINARAESALSKPMFRDALLSDPILLPANGFYEWLADSHSRNKTKYLFLQADRAPLYLAGFKKNFIGEDIPERFTILTTRANDSIRFCHDRMPLLIPENEIGEWLLGGRLRYFLDKTPPNLLAEKA